MKSREKNSTFFPSFFSFPFLFCFYLKTIQRNTNVCHGKHQFFLFVGTIQDTNAVIPHDRNSSGNNTPFS